MLSITCAKKIENFENSSAADGCDWITISGIRRLMQTEEARESRCVSL
jgi:hypothetical protein